MPKPQVAFDACDLATVEMACQLKPFAKYLLGSQIGIPLPGWPYDRVLAHVAELIEQIRQTDRGDRTKRARTDCSGRLTNGRAIERIYADLCSIATAPYRAVKGLNM